MGKIIGSCFGMMVGCGLVLILALILGGIGVYWYFNPSAKERSIDAAETTWIEVRGTVDESFEKVKTQSPPETEAPAQPAVSRPAEPAMPEVPAELPGIDIRPHKQ